MPIRNFEELVQIARQNGPQPIAVACADDETVLSGIRSASRHGLIIPILFGDKSQIKHTMKRLGISESWDIRHVTGDSAVCARRAVSSVRDGEAKLLMKGHLHTGTLFKAVLDKTNGLARRGILSHLAFVELADYHKIFATTDGGLNVNPDYSQKVEIVKNIITAFKCLDYALPKIGLLSYVEKVKTGDRETEQWAQITQLAKQGEFGDALVEGPLAMDLCLSKRAKVHKNYESEVAADVDGIVFPDITSCNASTKAMLFSGGIAAGIVVGAAAPIIALSRSDTPKMKYYSIAAAIALLACNWKW